MPLPGISSLYTYSVTVTYLSYSSGVQYWSLPAASAVHTRRAVVCNLQIVPADMYVEHVQANPAITEPAVVKTLL